MSAQEAAWFLLRQPMSKGSREVVYIPTQWPHQRYNLTTFSPIVCCSLHALHKLSLHVEVEEAVAAVINDLPPVNRTADYIWPLTKEILRV